MELGKQELETLKLMWHRWLKRDVTWAAEIVVKQGGILVENEFEFLRDDWLEKFETWMYPYVERLKDTEYITIEDAQDINAWAYGLMDVVLDAIHGMEVEKDG